MLTIRESQMQAMEAALKTPLVQPCPGKDELRFKLIMENELGLRIPEVEFEAELADGSIVSGKLGRDGIGYIHNPPPGPIAIQYPDYDDIKAKSLAARAQKACEGKNLSEIHFVLGHSRPLLRATVDAYATYFDTLSGEGMVEDIYKAIDRDSDKLPTVLLMARGGLAVHENIVYNHWNDEEVDS